ncbi:hypothetical protein BGX24_002263, partial [Mortierella sp. AD032]
MLEGSWSGNETDSAQQDFAMMNSSALNDRDRVGEGEGGVSGWGFEFDIEGMKRSTGTRRKQQNRNGDYHSGDQRSINGQGTDDDTAVESNASFRHHPEVAWEDRPETSNQNHERQQHHWRQVQERQGHHEHPSRHIVQRNINKDRPQQMANNAPGRSSHHQWYSRETGDAESSTRYAEDRGDRRTDDVEDDVWGLKRTEQWTALEEGEVTIGKDEVVLDEVTKYWAPSDIHDLLRPNRSQQAFPDKHIRRGGQPYDGDNWGDAPEPSMTYNGEYTNTVLVEQRKQQYWGKRDGEWVLLNQSSGTRMVAPQQKAVNSAGSEGDNGNDNSQTSDDESISYSQGYCDFHAEDSSSTHSADRESERGRVSGEYPAPAPLGPGNREFFSKMNRESSPEQFDLDSGFISEDEWRKPLSQRVKKQEHKESVQARKELSTSVQSSSALLVDLSDDATDESPWSPVSVNMVQSLIGLDFMKYPRETPQGAQPTTLDSTTADATTKVGEECAEDKIKQAKSNLSPLVTFASDNINKTSDSVKEPSSKEEPDVDLLGIGAPTQEPPKEDSLALLATVTATEETTKGDILIDLLAASNTSQESLKRDSGLVERAITSSTQAPHIGDATFDRFGAGSANQERSQSKGDLTVDISRARSPAKASSSGFLDDLGSPYAWLNQIASRNMRQSEESRAIQQEQWSALMAKQEEDSIRIQDFIQKATTASAIDSASSTSA